VPPANASAHVTAYTAGVVSGPDFGGPSPRSSKRITPDILISPKDTKWRYAMQPLVAVAAKTRPRRGGDVESLANLVEGVGPV
jgi:hypothetical protein